jgi:hypothetical protein
VGVFATYCQICGLPVQQDHYVPMEIGSMFYIWRGDGSNACDPIIPFGPEHAWLRRAVGLRLDERRAEIVVEGLVHDGNIEGGGDDDNVIDGVGDYRAALHSACWHLADRPATFEPLEHLELSAEEEQYRQQLFDFEAFVADGHAWMLVDPESDTPDGLRSRRRILAILEA